jgi:hypothetical protein
VRLRLQTNLAVRESRARRPEVISRLMMSTGSIISHDASFKLTKHVRVGDVNPFVATYSVMNEYGEILGAFMVPSKEISQVEEALANIGRRPYFWAVLGLEQALKIPALHRNSKLLAAKELMRTFLHPANDFDLDAARLRAAELYAIVSPLVQDHGCIAWMIGHMVDRHAQLVYTDRCYSCIHPPSLLSFCLVR